MSIISAKEAKSIAVEFEKAKVQAFKDLETELAMSVIDSYSGLEVDVQHAINNACDIGDRKAVMSKESVTNATGKTLNEGAVLAAIKFLTESLGYRCEEDKESIYIGF